MQASDSKIFNMPGDELDGIAGLAGNPATAIEARERLSSAVEELRQINLIYSTRFYSDRRYSTQKFHVEVDRLRAKLAKVQPDVLLVTDQRIDRVYDKVPP